MGSPLSPSCASASAKLCSAKSGAATSGGSSADGAVAAREVAGRPVAAGAGVVRGVAVGAVAGVVRRAGAATGAVTGAGPSRCSWVSTSCGSISSAPVPPRADGRKDTVSPCLRASRPTTASPSRVPENPVRSDCSLPTARSARRSCTSLMTRPLSSTVMTIPAGTSSTYTWTSAVGGEKFAALSRSSASACMTPSAAWPATAASLVECSRTRW
ncbi:hypothetical protein HY68_13420 [Streptomyces sp. AcH 505]|nr:hypothetical protein HY68_13420 [Streptomyces sp. AcH 505]